MEKTQVGSVSFEENPALFQVDTINVSPSPDTPLVADGKQTYTYTATVLDGNKQPINKKVTISHVNWGIGKDSNNKNLIWKPSNGDVATNEKGELTATLASHEKIENVTVSLSIEEKPSVEAKAVSFIRDTSGDRVSSKIQLTPQSPIFINAKMPYTFTAQYHDGKGNSLPNTKIPDLTWNITQDGNSLDSDILNKLTFTNSGDTTDNNGNITATLNSSIVIDRLMVTLSTSKGPSVDAPNDVAFIDNPKNFQIQNNRIEVESTPPGKKVLTSDGTQKFTYTAVIVGSDGTTPVEEGTEIYDVKWVIDPKEGELHFTHENGTVKAGKNGGLTATLTSTSTKEIDGIEVSLAIENKSPVKAEPVSFIRDASHDHILDSLITIQPDTDTLFIGGTTPYTFKAQVVDGQKSSVPKTKIPQVVWSITQNGNPIDVTQNKGLTFSNSGDTTDDEGYLTATLNSKVVIKDLLVQLSIKGQQQEAKAKHAVSFIENPKNYHVKVEHDNPDNPNKNNALINDVYTYTVTVTGKDGKSVSNQNVTWSFEAKTGQKQKVNLVPIDKVTDSQGQAKATLTSTEKATEVIVSAIVDGEQKVSDNEGVNFDWPAIDVKVSENPVFAGSSDGYKVTATVYRDENKTILYKGPNDNKGTDIKFAWLPAPEGTTLDIPSGGELKIGPEGILSNTLKGGLINELPVQKVNVCLHVVEPEAEPKACSPDISFYLDVEIKEITVTNNPSGKKILDGNGQDYYIYTAQVINKKTGKPLPDGYSFSGNIWSSDPEADTSENNGIPEMKFTRMDTKVTKGELIAHLSSNAGVGDVKNDQVTDGVKVTLTIPTVKGQPPETKSADIVAFSPVPQPAWIHIFSDSYPEGQTFKEQKKPYNTMYDIKNDRYMYGELINPFTGRPVASLSDDIKHEFVPDHNSFDFINTPNQPGVFYVDGIYTGTLTMNIKKSNKSKYIFTYDFDIQRYFYPYTHVLKTTDFLYDCHPSPSFRQMYATDLFEVVQDKPHNIPLIKEYTNLINWKVADPELMIGVGVYKSNTVQFIYNIKGEFPLYGDHTILGYPMCVLVTNPND
ncbi:Ig-like domain-containing protein [Xenorhabdus littoralis]|uniref:Ig-like domain-containing protein n=1 Tax=Xenorhabdus littoralis TaxID=2582835 RepID=UPI0029E7D068|nr:Ig-like domain-containing protein [Xenorhabdus sp. psl]